MYNYTRVAIDRKRIPDLLVKAELVARDALGVEDIGPEVFQFAEEVYRFCDRYRGVAYEGFCVAVEQMLRCLSGNSPAIRAAKESGVPG